MQPKVVTIRVKKKSNAPNIMAPTILVAAKVTAKSTNAAIKVPKIPVSKTGKTAHKHLLTAMLPKVAATKVKTNAARAKPNATQKKAGATVITAVRARIAVTAPIIIAATSDKVTQPIRQP